MGEGNGTPLQYSCPENPMDGGAWWAAVHGVTKSWTRLSDFTFTFHFHALEKEMATHSSVLAWRIPGTGEPGGLPSMGLHRVGHDWNDLAAAAYSITYSRQKYRFFRSSKNGWKLSQCRVYGLHWYSIMIQKYLAGYDEKVSGLQNPVNKGFQRKHLWKESSKHLWMRDVLSH